MSTAPRHVFQSPSVSDEKGTYRMRPPRSSRPGSNLRIASDPASRVYLHVPLRRTRRLAVLVVLLACGALACFVWAYWLFTARYGHVSSSYTALVGHDAPLGGSRPPDTPSTMPDEPDARLDALRADRTTRYLAYLPHSGLHNQRIALENALTLARLLNRTLLVPPARLGPKTLRYVRSGTLARMLRLSDKQQGRAHCAYIPADVPTPDECVDYMAYTLVPWAWLVDLGPIEAQQALVRASNGTAEWVEERLGVRPDETLFLPDTEPYEYRFVDTAAPAREGDKYLHNIPIDTLMAAPQRLIQLGTLFGSSRLRLRKAENRRIRGEVRRGMVFGNAALTLAAERIEEALGRTYVGVHVRVGDGRFQRGARENVRVVWWTLVRDVLGLDVQTALGLEGRVLPGGEDESRGPPEIPPDEPSLRVPHPPLPPLPDTFFPKHPCRSRRHATPSLRRLNVPLFIATDAPDGLDDPLLDPLARAFPCAFTLSSFTAETAHVEGLRNEYDGVDLAGYLAPVLDAMVLGRAWAVVGTEGSTLSRYAADVSWRVSHGWEIVERG